MKTPRKRKCKGCGELFQPSRKNQTHHTEACRKNHYERTRAAKDRKRKYSLSLLGTIAQAKYDSSYSGQERRRSYRETHTKPPNTKIIYPDMIPTSRSAAELILKNPKHSTAVSKAAAKKFLKPIYAHRDKCAATRTNKNKMIRDEALRIAEEKEIRPEEAFELLKALWTERGIQPRHWFEWKYYCNPDEWEELQIHRLEMKVQELAAEKNIPFDEAMAEHKKDIYTKAIGGVFFRAELMGSMNPSRHYTDKQFDQCMLDAANGFDFQWAGGEPVFIGSEHPKVEHRFRRVGHPQAAQPEAPGTTD